MPGYNANHLPTVRRIRIKNAAIDHALKHPGLGTPSTRLVYVRFVFTTCTTSLHVFELSTLSVLHLPLALPTTFFLKVLGLHIGISDLWRRRRLR
jgi:hypothetical protein